MINGACFPRAVSETNSFIFRKDFRNSIRFFSKHAACPCLMGRLFFKEVITKRINKVIRHNEDE